MGPLTWSLILLGAGLLLLCLEFFIPSGGILGFLAAASLLASLVFAFMAGAKWGILMLCVTGLLVPGVLVAAVKIWPHTPLGRQMLIQLPKQNQDRAAEMPLRQLVGKRGVAKSKMLPSGAIQVGGRTYDAVSEGMPIDQGQVIQVAAVHMNRLVVRPSQGPIDPASAHQEAHDPRLDDPLDKFGLEPLDDPLAD